MPSCSFFLRLHPKRAAPAREIAKLGWVKWRRIHSLTWLKETIGTIEVMASGPAQPKTQTGERISPLAGKPAPKELLADLGRLERDYYARRPDMDDPNQRVAFGTSGHRGTSLNGTFTEAHILAITQAICEYRSSAGTDGPLFLGKDTHALSDPAQRTAIEVLAANGVDAVMQRDNGVTPTPVISRAILAYNRGRKSGLADGIVITPSHNPPEDGGFKYNPPNGGPADTAVTRWIENRANDLLRESNSSVKRVPFESAIKNAHIRQDDFILPYVRDLRNVVEHGRRSRRESQAGRRSARRCVAALLGTDQR